MSMHCLHARSGLPPQEAPAVIAEKHKLSFSILRAGTVLTATAHVVTTVIGSGILSLTWAISTMGWIAGPVLLLAFAGVIWYTSLLLTDAYRHPKDSATRNRTYPQAVHAILGMHPFLLRKVCVRHTWHETHCMPQVMLTSVSRLCVTCLGIYTILLHSIKSCSAER